MLERMKRPYSAQTFEEVVHQIHDTLPHAGIGLDTLIGFPGETDAQFENTYALVERLPVSYLHVFPFSPRKGTPAYHFNPKVPSDVIKARCARMRELDRQKRRDFINANLGRHLKGLVQHQQDKETGMLKAVTGNYLTILVPEKQQIKGKIVDLICERCDSNLTIVGNYV